MNFNQKQIIILAALMNTSLKPTWSNETHLEFENGCIIEGYCGGNVWYDYAGKVFSGTFRELTDFLFSTFWGFADTRIRLEL